MTTSAVSSLAPFWGAAFFKLKLRFSDIRSSPNDVILNSVYDTWKTVYTISTGRLGVPSRGDRKRAGTNAWDGRNTSSED